jgi:protein-L-isoaspartate(D-aspartate) O-methyltransferase
MTNLSKSREHMVEQQIRQRGIKDTRVLDALRSVPRHKFVGPGQEELAYLDGPLPIGHEQTISQPYIVAFMTAALQIEDSHRALEIGTGCGYQAAVLSLLAKEVVTLERISELMQSAKARLRKLGYKNIKVIHADGMEGWRAGAPYDRIIGTAAPSVVPEALLEQLAPNGRMILPVGESLLNQYLYIITKSPQGVIHSKRSLAVRFVPMVNN